MLRKKLLDTGELSLLARLDAATKGYEWSLVLGEWHPGPYLLELEAIEDRAPERQPDYVLQAEERERRQLQRDWHDQQRWQDNARGLAEMERRQNTPKQFR